MMSSSISTPRRSTGIVGQGKYGIVLDEFPTDLNVKSYLLFQDEDTTMTDDPKNANACNRANLYNKQMVFKVTSDIAEYQIEKENSFKLAELDPCQKYFVYGIGFYDATPNHHSSRWSDTVGVMQIPFSGNNVNDLRSERFSYEQINNAIYNLLKGLVILHKNNYVHGDVHEKNVVMYIDKSKSQNLIARWIDFSKMKEADPEAIRNRYQIDMNGFNKIVDVIRGLADKNVDFNWTYDVFPKGIADTQAQETFKRLKYTETYQKLKQMRKRIEEETKSIKLQKKRKRIEEEPKSIKLQKKRKRI